MEYIVSESALHPNHLNGSLNEENFKNEFIIEIFYAWNVHKRYVDYFLSIF